MTFILDFKVKPKLSKIQNKHFCHKGLAIRKDMCDTNTVCHKMVFTEMFFLKIIIMYYYSKGVNLSK